ncbi:uncharacterized protein LOC131153591 [Malania oleifera]|uniref:uncharacterized protein LOC131153591 n=1 Tax=Malania oleifera TaxID=397392 RepID=UPI0025AEAD86|nr:uncharacterized protein LOC131153591 [Malania oleifera]
MSLLNQLFNRGLLGAKCKTCLNLAISRIKLVQNKRIVQLKQMRKEIAQFLQTGQEAIARIRVEHVIREQNLWAAYEILELFCEFVLARVPIIENQRECPSELQEAIASIIFAAPRCSDLPDLIQIKNLLTAKYGKEFVLAVSELRPDTSVNRAIIEKLSVSAPSVEARVNLLKEIAQEYSLDWDSSNSEAELSRKHEDLLDGPKKICSKAAPSQDPSSKKLSLESSSANVVKTVMTRTCINGVQDIQSSSPAGEKPLNKNHDVEPIIDVRKDTRSQSSDVLERAQAAIASAERASAAARAAAELVNIKFGWKSEEVSTWELKN